MLTPSPKREKESVGDGFSSTAESVEKSPTSLYNEGDMSGINLNLTAQDIKDFMALCTRSNALRAILIFFAAVIIVFAYIYLNPKKAPPPPVVNYIGTEINPTNAPNCPPGVQECDGMIIHGNMIINPQVVK